jgi:hypothetical protein
MPEALGPASLSITVKTTRHAQSESNRQLIRRPAAAASDANQSCITLLGSLRGKGRRLPAPPPGLDEAT